MTSALVIDLSSSEGDTPSSSADEAIRNFHLSVEQFVASVQRLHSALETETSNSKREKMIEALKTTASLLAREPIAKSN